jgi:5-methyltetrahydrofolate--homocysteine methyltransferase
MPYVATCSFDTAGRTMMGLAPADYPAVFDDLVVGPVALGANCGVGASDILVTTLEMTAATEIPVVTKGNCGIPQFHGTEIVYSGTPELMAGYAVLAADAGAVIVGGCCGTTPDHVAAMRKALDARSAGERPTRQSIVELIGPLANAAPGDPVGAVRRRRRAG